MNYSEEMISFPNRREKRLQGILCAAPGSAACVVMCYPFAEERKYSQPTLVRLARELAEGSIDSLRFDYSGCGNSEGAFEGASIAQWIDDVRCAIGQARPPRYRKTVCMGLRLGANLAWWATRDGHDCDGLILWNPLIDVRTLLTAREKADAVLGMFRGFRRKTKRESAEDSVARDCSGYALGRQMVEEIRACAPIDLNEIERDGRARLCWLEPDDPNGGTAPAQSTSSAALTAPGRHFWCLHNIRGTRDFRRANVRLIEGLVREGNPVRS